MEIAWVEPVRREALSLGARLLGLGDLKEEGG